LINVASAEGKVNRVNMSYVQFMGLKSDTDTNTVSSPNSRMTYLRRYSVPPLIYLKLNYTPYTGLTLDIQMDSYTRLKRKIN